jgi:hypothetical protein
MCIDGVAPEWGAIFAQWPKSQSRHMPKFNAEQIVVLLRQIEMC